MILCPLSVKWARVQCPCSIRPLLARMIGLSRTAFVGSTSTGLEVVQGDLLAWARQFDALPVADAEDGFLERAAG